MKEGSWLNVLSDVTRWGDLCRYFIQDRMPLMGAEDRPDPRDFSSQLPKGLPKNFAKREKSNNWEQARKIGWMPKKQSRNSCTAYSKGAQVEIVNTIEEQKPVYIDKEMLWAQQERTGASREYGDYIQNAQKQFHLSPQGFNQIEYRRLRREENNPESAAMWLFLGNIIQTGIYWGRYGTTTNYKRMKETGIFVPHEGQSIGGHAVLFVDVDMKTRMFKCFDPEVEKWGDNEAGIFWLRFDDFFAAFSKYIARDAINS